MLQRHTDFDPFRLDLCTLPRPDHGELPPAMCLVDEDGPYPRSYPTWLRWMAAGMAAAFVAATVLNAAATGGAGSVILGTGMTPAAAPPAP